MGVHQRRGKMVAGNYPGVHELVVWIEKVYLA